MSGRARRTGARPGSVAVLILAVLLSACVKKPPTGISLQAVSADVVFGIKTPEPALPNTEVDSADFEEESETVTAFSSRGRSIPIPVSTANPCPSAPASAAGSQEAPLNAEGLPAAGLYRWKRNGIQELNSNPGLKIPITGFERRSVTGVQRISSTDFRFSVVQPLIGSPEVVVIGYLVRTAATNTRPPGSPDRRVGEPDRGLSIEFMGWFDSRTGKESRTFFQPRPAVLILPLPVFAAERFSSAGVDPNSRQSLQIEGFVPKRELVDVCGTLIDGWRIEMMRTLSGEQQSTDSFVLHVATHMGAMPISEYQEVQNANGKLSLTINLGQVTPDPFPQAPR